MFALVPSALAWVNSLDSRVNLNNLNWFDRGRYKNSLPFQQCIDLPEFNAYADSNPHDNLRPEDVEPYRYQLGYSDQQKLAAMNPSDYIRSDDYSNVEDLRCSTLDEFKQWAKSHPSHRIDEYYTLFGWNDQSDYETRGSHFPSEDYANPFYVSDRTYGTVMTDGKGGFSSFFPFD